MILKDISIKDINIKDNYKKDYNPNISEFTHIYAYKEENIVSFIVFDIIYERCEIIDVYTLDESRNQGYASKLINQIINDFNVENITLEVNINNITAIKLYEKLGFSKASIRKGYYDGIDGLLMIKEVR